MKGIEFMKQIHIKASKEYDVIIGEGILSKAGELAKKFIKPCRAAVITDDTVDELYGDTVTQALEKSGYPCIKYVFPHGEESKCMGNFVEALEFLAENKLTRSDIVVALGGGVVGDLAGFVASAYLRGVKFIQIPTTFLAAVDSSVGGKTAVNLHAGKNLAGAFHQPSLVVCDTDTFKTLPEDTFADGVAETIKYGMITDEALFEKMSGDFRQDICAVTARCVEIKGYVVAQDEFDTGMRQLLNLGHTVGHAIEKCSNLGITHGHAVAIGMMIVSRSAEKRGWAEKGTTDRLKKNLVKCGLPTSCSYSAEELARVALNDKKRMGGEITLVIPEKAGKSVLKKIPVDEITQFIAEGLA